MTEPRFTEAQVSMISVSSGMYDLPDDLLAASQDPEWWKRLIGRSRAELTVEQRRMLGALDVPAFGEREDDDDEQ